MELHWINFVQHILNLIILFLILRTFLYRPVSKFMAEREAKFAKEREAITTGRQEAAALKTQLEESLAGAKRVAEELADERVKAAEREAEEIRQKARQDAQRLLGEANAQALAERDEMMAELRDQTAVLAVDLAGHILEREVTAADNQSIIDGFFKKVG